MFVQFVLRPVYLMTSALLSTAVSSDWWFVQQYFYRRLIATTTELCPCISHSKKWVETVTDMSEEVNVILYNNTICLLQYSESLSTVLCALFSRKYCSLFLVPVRCSHKQCHKVIPLRDRILFNASNENKTAKLPTLGEQLFSCVYTIESQMKNL
jgi:hypothetical protein